MKALKNPVVAVILAIIMIVASTLLSAGVKLGKETQKITDGFYDGVEYDGYNHTSIYSQLGNICGAADGIVAVASRYDIDCSNVSYASGDLKSSLSTMHNEISSIYSLYDDLCTALNSIYNDLDGVELSSRDSEGIDAYKDTITNAQRVIGSAGYNESVRTYINSLGFPANLFVKLCNVDTPEYFA